MRFAHKNNLFGWLVFAITLVIYYLTLEPATSFWDCSEFIVSAYKLEINHAPGAPLFMLLGRLFSLLAGGDSMLVAKMINLLSAVASAATVMLLFWTITWLGQKITAIGPSLKTTLVLLAGTIGALTFAFTDSFWFSAVEGEVYALSSFFTALVLWFATKWEREAEKPYAQRWLLCIIYFTGLSIGVHLLNLLALPSVIFIYYFKKYNHSLRNLIVASVLSAVIPLFIMVIFVPGFLRIGARFDLLFVNTLNLPLNSGLLFYLALVLTSIALLIWYSEKHKKVLLNFIGRAFLFLILGYSTYAAVFIRSKANTPVDQGNPETAYMLLNYLNREQYGSAPLFYGNSFNAVVESIEERYTYEVVDGKYVPSRLIPDVTYDKRTCSLFPRMYSSMPGHPEAYKKWSDFKGKPVVVADRSGETKRIRVPTLGEHLKFYFRYQLGFMYVRYFMWNFVGRQNNVQGHGGLLKGNWISGIRALDEMRLGPQEGLPTHMATNKARNRYYFLPLLLGFIGFLYHYRRDKKNFSVILLLFFLTGIALTLYFNAPPRAPRERDYVYVGSFYAFSVWIGLSVFALNEWLEKFLNKKLALAIAGTVCIAAAPLLLITENYDDHDRSDRYIARDFARNVLESCEPNAILFTHADNDTYPLWYCQEVEGIRRDIRVVVMPYLAANWYIGQMQQEFYDDPGLKMQVPFEKYKKGQLDYLPVISRIDKRIDIGDAIRFVANDSAGSKVKLNNGEMNDYFPVCKVAIPVEAGKDIPVQIEQKYWSKNQLAFWDIIASNIGGRPIYFSSVGDARDNGISDYLRLDGFAFKLVPEKFVAKSIVETGAVDSDNLYDKIVHTFSWGNMGDANVYLDWHNVYMLKVFQVTNLFNRLASSLIDEGETEKALEVLNACRSLMPKGVMEIDIYSMQQLDLYFQTGDRQKAMEILKGYKKELFSNLDYYVSFDKRLRGTLTENARYLLYLIQELGNTLKRAGYGNEANELWQEAVKKYQQIVN